MKSQEATNGGGECCGKKFGCKLGALQRAFQEPAFLRQGGDALTPFMIFSVPSYSELRNAITLQSTLHIC